MARCAEKWREKRVCLLFVLAGLLGEEERPHNAPVALPSPFLYTAGSIITNPGPIMGEILEANPHRIFFLCPKSARRGP